MSDLIKIENWTFSIDDGEPRMRDIDLAEWLKYERPRVIRDLIARLIADGKLKDIQMRRSVRRIEIRPGVFRDDVVNEYWLTEAQALYVIAKSGTDVAHAVLSEVIRVYVEAKRRASLRSLPPDLAHWLPFVERSQLHTTPPGYFSVFQEMREIMVIAIQATVAIDHRTIPDISAGLVWGEYWKKNNLDARYGQRVRHDHNYPESHPQSRSNPQDMWVYPVEALGEFRRWLDREYLPLSFPKYIAEKVKQTVIAPVIAKDLLNGVRIHLSQLPSGGRAKRFK